MATEQENTNLVENIHDALFELTEDLQTHAIESARQGWVERGEDPLAFDVEVPNLADIDTDEARALCAVWKAFNVLYALQPPMGGLVVSALSSAFERFPIDGADESLVNWSED